MRRAVVAAAAAAIVAPAFAGCGHGGKKAFVDLVRLKAVPPTGHTVTAHDLDRSVDVIRGRLDKLGLDDAEVAKRGGNVIVVRVPPSTVQRVRAAVVSVIRRTGLLEFYDFEAHLAGPSVRGASHAPVATPSIEALLSDPATRALAKTGAPSRWYVRHGRRLAVPEGTVVVACETKIGNCLSVRAVTTSRAFYLLTTPPEMTGKDLEASATHADVDPNTSQPIVVVGFTQRGQRRFHEITRREARRGAALCRDARSSAGVQRCAQHFAIVLDHEILSAPYVDFVRNPNGIPGDNGVQIVGPTLREAKRLAIALQSGALPVRFVRLP